MYEKTYGYRYEELGTSPRTADIARAIRADIKRAKAEGLLPARWTYSVRSRNFTGGCAVDVTVKNCPDAWQECDGIVPGSRQPTPSGGWTAIPCGNVWCKASGDPRYAHAAEVHYVLTEEAAAARMTLERIHGAYNHTGSDTMIDYFDVRYYGHVSFEQ
jgi:hypothetical protein